MPVPRNRFEVLLVADDAYRVAMLRREMHRAGLCLTMRRLGTERDVRAYLERCARGDGPALPALILIDFATADRRSTALVRDLAFRGMPRQTPVVLLTSEATETALDSGQLDEGESTMFSPRKLRRFLTKLAAPRREQTLAAVRTLCRYGPLLVRQPAYFLERRSASERLTA